MSVKSKVSLRFQYRHLHFGVTGVSMERVKPNNLTTHSKEVLGFTWIAEYQAKREIHI